MAASDNDDQARLADYIVAVPADCPQIDVTFLDYPDFNLNPLGARGVGETGLEGVAAANYECSPPCNRCSCTAPASWYRGSAVAR